MPHYTPYIAASESPKELTLRALALGSALGVVFAASSVYLAVRVGMTVSASIPIAVLSIALFRAFGRQGETKILENTIVQTAGSAGESLAFGVAAALPALLYLGYDLNLFHAFLVAALGGVLGVLMMIPLRHGLIVQEHGRLIYPEGTACADVLIVGEKGGTEARTVIAGFTIGATYKLGYYGLKLWREVVGTALGWIGRDGSGAPVRRGLTGGSIAMEVSPELLGVGYIIGPKIAGVTFAGGVLSYLILIPLMKFFGEGLSGPLVSPSGLLIRNMSPDQIRNHYVLYIGAGAVATGGLVSLLRSLPTLVSAFRRGVETFLASRKRDVAAIPPRTEQDLPITVVFIGALLLVLAIWLAPPLQLNLVSAFLILLCGFFFVTVSARITGEIGSSSNPISGMVVATLLITCLVYLTFGWTSPSDRFMALTTAAIVGIAASNGGTTAQDLKTAYLVGGTPRRQQLALFAGVLTSALFIGGTLYLLNESETAIIPESHPEARLTEVTSEIRESLQFPFELDEKALADHRLRIELLERLLWAKGLELYLSPEGNRSLRSFHKGMAAELAGVTLKLDGGGTVTVGDLGRVGAPLPQSYRVGFARGVEGLPNGKYLVDSGGAVRYLVDPGIGGRISEHLGKKLVRFDAPKARLFSLIIDGILARKLPWDLVLLGVFIALMLELAGVSSLPFGVGVYLPISTTTPIFVGGMIRKLVDRLTSSKQGNIEAEFSPGVLLSSGYIAGGAIAGVLLAMLAVIPGGERIRNVLDLPSLLGQSGVVGGFLSQVGETELPASLGANLWALSFFSILVVVLVRAGLKRARK